MNDQPGEKMTLSQYLQLCIDHFNLEELRNLCFELRVDFEELKGDGKTAKFRELILYMGMRNRLIDLNTLFKQKRKQVAWPTTPPIWFGSIQSWPQALEYETFAQAIGLYLDNLRRQALGTNEIHAPYKELHPFEVSEARIFFGREQAMATMVNHIHHARLTILHGAPGIGKTSLIRAGLMPRLLAENHFPIMVRTLEDDPTVALKRMLLRNLQQTPTFANTSLRDFLFKISDLVDEGTSLFVFFDQFEAFLMQNSGSEEQMRFIVELSECIDDRSLPVHFILSLQDKYIGQISTFQSHIEFPLAYEYLLRPFTHDQARSAIVEPLRQVNGRFQKGLVNTLLADFRVKAIQPAHLQLLCGALYKKQLETQSAVNDLLITADTYTALGGLEAILQGRLDRVLTREMPEEQRLWAKKVLSILVTTEYRRDRKSETELSDLLLHTGITTDQLRDVLKALVNNGLLYRLQVGDVGEKEVFELAHDYLIEEIKPWVDVDQLEAKRVNTMLIQGHAEYKNHNHLFDARQLGVVAAQLTNVYLSLTETDYQFLLISAICQGADISPWVQKYSFSSQTWLREYQRQSSNPESRRLAVTAVLGQMEDEETWADLNNPASTSAGNAYGAMALAHFIYGSRRRRSYPRRLWWSVEWHLAKLQLEPHRKRLALFKRTAGYAGAIGAVTGVVDLFKDFLRLSPEIAFGLLFLFPLIGFFLAQSWGDVSGRIWLIFRRKRAVGRTAAFIVTSIVMGYITMLFVTLENFGWAVGFVLGIVLALLFRLRPSSRLPRWLLSILFAGLMVVVAFSVWVVIGIEDDDLPQLPASLWATGIFGIVFMRQIILHLVPIRE